MGQYTVVISPPKPVIDQVAVWKKQLEDRIGFYPSCHSLAHITFCLFSGAAPTLNLWEQYLAEFTAALSPFPLCFDQTGSFSNGAFFLAPDEESKAALLRVMKQFYLDTPAPFYGKSLMPHISIGRRLNADQLSIAYELLQQVSLRFVCEDLVIRVFNEERRQYDIYRRFPLSVGT